eukprot:scpid45898/ scgid11468/ 
MPWSWSWRRAGVLAHWCPEVAVLDAGTRLFVARGLVCIGRPRPLRCLRVGACCCSCPLVSRRCRSGRSNSPACCRPRFGARRSSMAGMCGDALELGRAGVLGLCTREHDAVHVYCKVFLSDVTSNPSQSITIHHIEREFLVSASESALITSLVFAAGHLDGELDVHCSGRVTSTSVTVRWNILRDYLWTSVMTALSVSAGSQKKMVPSAEQLPHFEVRGVRNTDVPGCDGGQTSCGGGVCGNAVGLRCGSGRCDGCSIGGGKVVGGGCGTEAFLEGGCVVFKGKRVVLGDSAVEFPVNGGV